MTGATVLPGGGLIEADPRVVGLVVVAVCVLGALELVRRVRARRRSG